MIDIKFTADGFSVLGDDHPDHLTKRAKALKKQPYDVVYRLGFFKPQSWFSPALTFLHSLTSHYIHVITTDPLAAAERERYKFSISDDQIYDFLDTLPFVMGYDFVDVDWIKTFFERIHSVFIKNISDRKSVV